jgi:hypothetical protein
MKKNKSCNFISVAEKVGQKEEVSRRLHVFEIIIMPFLIVAGSIACHKTKIQPRNLHGYPPSYFTFHSFYRVHLKVWIAWALQYESTPWLPHSPPTPLSLCPEKKT